MRRGLFVVGGWLLAAAIAAGVGVLAVSLLSSSFAGTRVRLLDQQTVARDLAKATGSAHPPSSARPSPRAPSPSVPASSTPGRSPASHPVSRSFASPGGAVVARCTATNAYLVSWTPGQGFETDEHVRGPAKTAYVSFDSDGRKVFVTVSCRNGVRCPDGSQARRLTE
jgi:hypothetical protein